MENSIRSYADALVKECERVLGCMHNEHPSTANYSAMTDVLVKLDGIVADIDYNFIQDLLRKELEKNKAIAADTYYEALTNKPEPFPTTVSVPEPVGEPEPTTVVEEVPWVEDTEEKELTREDVRAICKDMAAKGVLVQPIMTKYIPEGKSVTLSNLKSADYPAFVKELKNAQ